MIDPEVLQDICELVVEENRRRAKAGADARKALWLCYDQVYFQLVYGGSAAMQARHATPPEVCPDVAPYTIMLDAASKTFAATGMRVGWAVMPPAARQRMADILGHVGAWAPKAEQVAMAALLDDERAIAEYHARDAHGGAGAPGPPGRRLRRDAPRGPAGRGRSRRRARSICRCAW